MPKNEGGSLRMPLDASPVGNSRGLVTVLMARFSAIGDVAMTIPVIYSACRCYPDIRFVMLTRPALCGMFVEAPENLRVIGADVKGEYRGLKGLWRLASEMRREFQPDAFLDLHNVLRTNAIGFFLGLHGIRRFTLQKARARRRALTRRRNKVMLPLISQRARYREVFFQAGVPVSDRFHGLYGCRGKAPVQAFACITAPKSSPEEKWVGIAPFAAHAGKVYPPEKMAEVLDRLIAEGPEGLRVFLFGGGGSEAELLSSWAGKYPGRVVSLAGKKYGFPAELALLNHLDAMVAMDSANMHFAALAQTPTLSIWGATHPYCGFKAWGQSDDNAIQLPLSCRPCSVFGAKPCYRGDYLCLTAIRPDSIFKRVIELLEKHDQ